jgi:hypothetical protein
MKIEELPIKKSFRSCLYLKSCLLRATLKQITHLAIIQSASN